MNPPGQPSPWHTGIELFFSWHRDYIAGLEQFILDQGCDICPDLVPLPYWDITQPLSDPFYNSMIPEFAVEDALITAPQPLFITPQEETWSDFIEIDESTCTEYESPDALADWMLGRHAQVHFEMGGAMRSFASTAGTAVFWLYHAYIDEKYYCYQQICQCPEPVVSISNRDCDVCLDLENSINADDFILTLVDEFGNESSVTLNLQGCISYRDLNQGDNYTLKIEAINTSMLDNIDCLDNEIEVNFTAPEPPSSKFNPNPCIRAIPLPQFPSPTSLTGNKVVKVTNTGIKREFTFINSIHNTGSHTVLASPMILEENEEVFITIPQASQGYGINYFTIHVDGETAAIEYINQ